MATAALGLQLVDLGGAQRDQRDLRGGEDTTDEHEGEDQQDVEPGSRFHADNLARAHPAATRAAPTAATG